MSPIKSTTLKSILALCTLFGSLGTPSFGHYAFGPQTVLDGNYLKHKVAKGETLYAISRKYGVSVDDIKKANPSMGGLQAGQVINIPKKVLPASTNTSSNSSSSQYHTVKSGETLYAVSRKYGVSVNDIKAWNKLSGNNLEVGQRLVVKKPSGSTTTTTSHATTNSSAKYHTVKKGETLYAVSRQHGVSVNDIKKWNNLSSNSLEVGQRLKLSASGSSSSSSRTNTTSTPKRERANLRNENLPSPSNYKKFKHTNQSGTIRLTEETKYNPNPPFSYCLHPTLPIGAVIEIHNPDNDKVVYGRVMGRSPQGDPYILRANKRIFELLGVTNPTEFQAKLVYPPRH